MSTNGKTLKFRAAKLKGFTVPREVVEFPTVNMFKNRLDIYWKEMGTK